MNQDHMTIQRALFSVSDKSGLASFAKGMLSINPALEIIASGGTAQILSQEKLPFVQLSEKTQFPESFHGRVKTLHPVIFGGILYRRDIDKQEAAALKIEPIDLVVCNFYPFKSSSEDPHMPLANLLESMDIGGSALIRSACKNFFSVAVIVDPLDYLKILEELSAQQGVLSLNTRKELALKAMQMSAAYEALIASECAKKMASFTYTGRISAKQEAPDVAPFDKGIAPAIFEEKGATDGRLAAGRKMTEYVNEAKKMHKDQAAHLHLLRGRKLRYGENPDQEGWVYCLENQEGVATSKVLSGKELSYNNYEDASQAFFAVQNLYQEQKNPIVALVKHGGLCGFATGNTIQDAFETAWNSDSKSAFGSIAAFSAAIEENFRYQLKDRFLEMLLAPSFNASFIEWVLANRPSLRLMQVPLDGLTPLLYRGISGGVLVQTAKKNLYSYLQQLVLPARQDSEPLIGVVTKRMPLPEHIGLFRFAIAAVQSVKSNAIVIAREYTPNVYGLIGIGGGQPNRIDSLQKLALPRAVETLQKEIGEEKIKEALGQAVLVSDGFFPFTDAIDIAAKYGIKTCLQPGGSIRDKEVIHAADQHDLCMIFTGQRYFNH